MGIKENFAKAFRELTGGDKEADKKSLSEEELEKAVEAYSNQRMLEIAQNVEELEKAVDAYGSGKGGDALPAKDAQVISQSADVSPKVAEPVREPLPETTGEIPLPEPAAQKSQASAETFESAEVPPKVAEPVREPSPEPARELSPEPVAQKSQASAGASESAGGFQTASANTGADRPAGNIAAPAAFTGFRQTNDADDTNEITIISKNTIIDGNVRSFADMSITGDIRGDVETTKNIELNGKIVGNIICNNAFMHRSQVQGGIHMKGNLSMKRDTLLIGDLVSTYAEINGKIKGNIDVAGKAELKADAVVFGDINASTITVEDGAVIQGRVDTVSLSKDSGKNLFPEMVVIGEGY